ncbi:MAG: hypothetical protein EOP35_01045 [Rubrivivax sp.]|nr:MAG: hypothetical protein EOP35_01045 [Rubrivivax sp.]
MRTGCWPGSSRTSGRPAGTSGPRSCCPTPASRNSSATCRMPGSRPTTCAPRSTCWPGSAKLSTGPRAASCWPPASRRRGARPATSV